VAERSGWLSAACARSGGAGRGRRGRGREKERERRGGRQDPARGG